MLRQYGPALAPHYDAIHCWKNYALEVRKLVWLLQRLGVPRQGELLDAACGTGRHLSGLARQFSVTGLDSSRAMIKIARKRTPRATFIAGDLRAFRTNRRFDAITCLFGSIGHLPSYRDLEKTISNFARHLRPGGVVAVEEFGLRRASSTSGVVIERADGLVRLTKTTRKRGRIAFESHLLIRTPRSILYDHETMMLSVFKPQQILAILRSQGFKAWCLKGALTKDRALYVGVYQPAHQR